MPLLSDEELRTLAEDIKANGLKVKIVVHDGQVLDGRNRLRACELAGVKPDFEPWNGAGGSPTQYVLSMNVHRRHLDASQRALVGARAIGLFREEANRRQRGGRGGKKLPVNLPEARGDSRDQVAAVVGVSGKSVSDAEKVLDVGAPELVAAVEQGKIAVSAAAKVANLPGHEQRAIVAKIDGGEAKNPQEAKRRIADEKRAAQPRVWQPKARIFCGDAVANLRDLQLKAHCVVMDPPYGLETHRTRKGGKDYADGETYALELLEAVCKELVQHLDPSAHLYVFSGYSYVHAFREILARHFEVQANPLIWVKDNHTLCDFSKWYGNKHEYVLFAKQRGSKRELGAGQVADVFTVARTRESTHSAEKPTELLTALIEKSTAPGELVLDPFCGSGSTGVAAVRLGREFVGIEIEKKWADVARARVAPAAVE